MSSNEDWIKKEFESINISDPRLNKRFFKIANELADRPADSIHSASADWAASKASYRFFDNSEVDSQKISAPHFESTAWRCLGYNKIILTEDTSYIDYNKHSKTKNLGRSFKSHGQDIRGICMHAGLALSPTGLPLGLLYNKLWTRKENKVSDYQRDALPLQLKESYRWIECGRRAKELLDDQQVILVMDREGDIFEAYEDAIENNYDVVIRCQHDRVLDSELKISEELSTLNVRGYHSVIIPGNGSRKEKKVKLSIRFKKIELSARPSGQKTQQNKGRMNTEIYVVDASDINNDVSWRIMTTLPVEKLQDAKDVLNYYKMRWSVELYFKTLKTGCTIEDCRLREAGKLIKYISLMSVVAWRIYWMVHISRHDPDMSCENVLMKSEWKAAWWLLHRKKVKEGRMKKSDMPSKPPSIKEAIRWIAGNGGFKGRKSDGDPGLISVWRGWNKVLIGAEMFELMNE